MKKDVRVVQVHPNRRGIADEMNIVAARGQLLAKFGCDDSGAAVGGITRYADTHRFKTRRLQTSQANTPSELAALLECRPTTAVRIECVRFEPG